MDLPEVGHQLATRQANIHGEMDEMNRHVIASGEFPHGLTCMDCDVPLRPGDTYSKRLIAFMADAPVVEPVCVPCAMWGEEKAG